MRLPCGHLFAPLCAETIPGQHFTCKESSGTNSLPCGHTREVLPSKEPAVGMRSKVRVCLSRMRSYLHKRLPGLSRRARRRQVQTSLWKASSRLHSHQDACSMICSLPCDRVPCDELCTMFLDCEVHLCPSLCMETCMTVCSQCEDGELYPSI
jgi:hypothetical protein